MALFHQLEKHPLTPSQMKACVSSAQNTLVLAGAGTGKTSTLMGRLVHLWESGISAPQQVLLLAFGVDAAQEMQQRAQRILDRYPQLLPEGQRSFKAQTFHSLGLSIIRQVEGKAPNVTQLSQEKHRLAFMQEWINTALESDTLFPQPEGSAQTYRHLLWDYLCYFEYPLHSPLEMGSHYGDYCQQYRWRSLADDYVQDPIAYLWANYCYRRGVTIWHEPWVPEQYAQTYVRFYCPQFTLWVRIVPQAYDQVDVAQQQRWRQHHSAHCVEIYPDALWSSRGDFLRIETSHQQWPWAMMTAFAQMCDAWWQAPLNSDFALSTSSQYPSEHVNAKGGASFSQGRLQGAFDMIKQVFDYLRAEHLSQADWLDGAQSLEGMDKSLAVQSERCYRQKQLLYALCAPMVEAYREGLVANGEIDFDMMIVRATQYIEQGRYQVPWQEVLIDEFQDISSTRFALILAMRSQQPALRLFCVGDDWQTIFQFAGSRLQYIRYFDHYVGPTALMRLDTTFRFHQQLSDVSSAFVQKNPMQYRKQLQAHRKGDYAGICLVGLGALDETPRVKSRALLTKRVPTQLTGVFETESALWQRWIDMAMQDVQQRYASRLMQGLSILVLARFRHYLPSDQQVQALAQQYPFGQWRASTIHAAKGQEADIVIVLGVHRGPFGLPSEKQSRLSQLKNDEETFAHAQERRVFYVAITRAKEHVYLCFDPEQVSAFVQELRQMPKACDPLFTYAGSGSKGKLK